MPKRPCKRIKRNPLILQCVPPKVGSRNRVRGDEPGCIFQPIAYWLDKSAAQSGQRQISEASLLTVGLFGGWPGVIVAQQALTHKTVEISFRVAFWATVILNVGAFPYVTSSAFSGVAKG